MGLPTDAKARKAVPIYSGVLKYFPDAIAAVAECSRAGNEQHHPGEPLWWDKSKSTDEHDAMIRHAMEAGAVDRDGIRHSAKVAWRALAALQREIDGDTVPMIEESPLPILDAYEEVEAFEREHKGF